MGTEERQFFFWAQSLGSCPFMIDQQLLLWYLWPKCHPRKHSWKLRKFEWEREWKFPAIPDWSKIVVARARLWMAKAINWLCWSSHYWEEVGYQLRETQQTTRQANKGRTCTYCNFDLPLLQKQTQNTGDSIRFVVALISMTDRIYKRWFQVIIPVTYTYRTDNMANDELPALWIINPQRSSPCNLPT